MRCCLCLVVLDILRDQMVAFDFLHTQSPIFSGTEDLHALKKILCWRKRRVFSLGSPYVYILPRLKRQSTEWQ